VFAFDFPHLREHAYAVVARLSQGSRCTRPVEIINDCSGVSNEDTDGDADANANARARIPYDLGHS